VIDTTPDGHGIASIDGKRVFIAGALRGEIVSLRRVRARRNYDEAELVGVSAVSADRVEPPCSVFGRCGGCSLQHLSGTAQVALKEADLVETLRRIGNVSPGRVMPAVAGPAWGYRRRARLAVRFVAGKGRVLVGFSERGSSKVTEMERCHVLHPRLAVMLGLLSELIGGLSVAGRIPQVEVAVADNAVALVFRVLDEPTAGDIQALRRFRDQHDLRILLQRGGPEEIVPLDSGRDDAELWYSLPEHELKLGFLPVDFIQVNEMVNRRMVSLALDLLQPTAAMRVVDLFCGIGNFSLPVARRVAQVLGVEGSAAMVERARGNAQRNGLENTTFRAADLSSPAGAIAWHAGHVRGASFDAALLDPPRAGAAVVLPELARAGVRRIVYVSCHPATLARDAGVLVKDLGYRFKAAGILDMFPHTGHSESIGLFEKD
jgi:23S rRNA (uracil1939-C5)-methyltransferase